MVQWAQLSFMLKDVLQTLKVIVIVSLPIAAAIALGCFIVLKTRKRRRP